MSIAQERGIHTRPSEALRAIPADIPVPPGDSGIRKLRIAGSDFVHAVNGARIGLSRLYPMADLPPELTGIHNTAPAIMNDAMTSMIQLYREKMEDPALPSMHEYYYGIILDRLRGIFASTLDAEVVLSPQVDERLQTVRSSERGRVMIRTLSEEERSIVEDLCRGYAFGDSGKTEAMAWAITYPLQRHLLVSGFAGMGHREGIRQVFLLELLNIDLGRMAA